MEYLLFLPRTKSRSHDSALGEKKVAERVENQVNSKRPICCKKNMYSFGCD